MLPISSTGPSTTYPDTNHQSYATYRKSYGSAKYIKHCHSNITSVLNNPNSKRSLLIILSVIFLLGTYLYYSLSGQHYDDFENYSDLNDKNKRIYFPNRFPDLFEKSIQSDLMNTKINFQLDYTILHENQQEKLWIYLTALHRAISVMELPLTASLRKALKDCEYYEKPSIYDSSSQHALELKFPELLRFLDKAGNMLENGQDTYYHHVLHLLQLLHPQAITISLGEERGYEQEGKTRQHYHSNHLNTETKSNMMMHTALDTDGIEEGSVDKNKNNKNNQNKPKNSLLTDHEHVFEEPLIYYVNSYFYSVVHCTHHPQLKEDWKSGFRYLQEIAPMVVSASEWRNNEGLDFLSPATHPKAGLFITSLVDSAPNVHRFSRQSFMRVDFDLTGYSPKDIVVPYYVATSPEEQSSTDRSSHVISTAAVDGTEENIVSTGGSGSIRRFYERRSTSSDKVESFSTDKNDHSSSTGLGEKEKLLVFIGHDHPVGGIRSQFKRELNKLSNVQDVLFVTYDGEDGGNSVIEFGSSSYGSTSSIKYSEKDYREILRKATFCLSIRGDTSSAARLFTIIDIGGCIPIIISDWQTLPFESIIDYSKFSLRFSERVVHDLPAMLTMLRKVSPEKIQSLRHGLQEAKSLLLFENSNHDLSILNPVSLTLIEFIQNREKYCSALNDVNLPPLCMKIMNRLHTAEHLLKEKKLNTGSMSSEKVALKSIAK